MKYMLMLWDETGQKWDTTHTDTREAIFAAARHWVHHFLLADGYVTTMQGCIVVARHNGTGNVYEMAVSRQDGDCEGDYPYTVKIGEWLL